MTHRASAPRRGGCLLDVPQGGGIDSNTLNPSCEVRIMKTSRSAIAIALLCLSAGATAADYVYLLPLGTPLNESVRYGFDDSVTFTPPESGVYNVDVVASTVYGGCSTRYCHSKWSIVTTITSETLTDGSGTWPLVQGNVTLPMAAGVPYVLHLSGVGTGTGVYAGYGAYSVSIAQLQ
jgi:hypothetical protein